MFKIFLLGANHGGASRGSAPLKLGNRLSAPPPKKKCGPYAYGKVGPTIEFTPPNFMRMCAPVCDIYDAYSYVCCEISDLKQAERQRGDDGC